MHTRGEGYVQEVKFPRFRLRGVIIASDQGYPPLALIVMHAGSHPPGNRVGRAISTVPRWVGPALADDAPRPGSECILHHSLPGGPA